MEPMHERMQKWMNERLEYCSPAEASKYEDLKTALQIAFLDARPVHFTEAGFCEQAKGQHRVRGKETKTFYKVALCGEKAGPVKLR